MIHPTRPSETFKDFQGFTDTAREFAALHGLHRTPEERFRLCSRQSTAANDNMPEGAGFLMISLKFMEMLRVWVDCDRDMMRAKLTYIENGH